MKDYRGIFSKMGEQLVEKYIEDLKKKFKKREKTLSFCSNWASAM